MTLLPRFKVVLALVAAALLALPLPGQAHGRRDRMLESVLASKTGQIPVIVKTRSGKAAKVEARLANRGRRAHKRLGRGRAIVTWLTPADIEALANDSDVESLSFDAPVRPTALPGDPVAPSGLQLLVGAPATTLAGSGIGVAIIDSGIAPIPGLAERISAFYDFTSGAVVERQAIDPYGHGTHVAGIVGGALADGVGGIAPNVHFIGLRVLDSQGSGTTSMAIDAVDYAVENREALGIDVINLSIGHPIYESAATDPLVQAVERAVRAGIVVVASAGNVGTNPQTGEIGYAGVLSPGNAPSAITVGAVSTNDTPERSDDRVTSFSSRGPAWIDGAAKPDLVAPGSGIVSAMSPNSTIGGYSQLQVVKPHGVFLKLSGTSMAAPVVSGVAALVLQAADAACVQGPGLCPALTPGTVKAILEFTATPLVDENGVTYDALTQGRGEVNAAGAVEAAQAIDTTMPVGEPWLRYTLPASTPFGAETATWSQSIVWGTQLLSGGVLNINGLAWDDSIVWGTSDFGDSIVWGTFDFGDSIVWGTFDDSIVWGTSVVWDDSIVWGTSIVWGSDMIGLWDGDSIVWGTFDWDSIVWGTFDWDSIVWGTADWDSIVWGTSLLPDQASEQAHQRAGRRGRTRR